MSTRAHWAAHKSHGKNEAMDIINNQGAKIGSLTHAVSSDTSITINRIHDVTIFTTRDRN